MNSIKFIHVADLHLDSPFKGLTATSMHLGKKLKESTFIAFNRVVDQAIKEAVDLVIIAGDIFDLEDRSIRAQMRFKRQVEQLIDAGIGVFISFGNHDYVSGTSSPFRFHEKVHIFGPDPEKKTFLTKNNVAVHLYGFSYEQRHIYDRKIDLYEKCADDGYHIGILHGQLQSNKEHDMYAPFTINDLLLKEMDYWALGHIHKREVLHTNPYIIYPGNIQGRHKNEEGIKGGYLVEIAPNKTTISFFETSEIIWERAQIDGSTIQSMEELSLVLEQLKEKNRANASKILSIQVMEFPATIEINDMQIEEMMEVLNEEEIDDSFVYINELKVEKNWTLSELFTSSEFYSKLFQPLENETFEKELMERLTNKQSKKYATSFASIDEIEKRADERLKELLSKGASL